ncbi:MAG: hypothetical protein NXY57DRAFT_1041080 [Lentinula lateritia]|uniref:Cysteine dioxygenase n=1 Tax=Lentinula lateritia TaxID=40482 RepID=A0ABQ8V449_9AGAR|nr:MAG: hypothetical protein NXY57DRAFT_1041080 [Lentinula lateritia]KAJ4473466.1 hypothetical protein C8R41DRAFT_870207 [Lentinula lateritia]
MSFQYAFLDPFAYFDTPRGNLAPHPLPGSHLGPTGNPKEGLDANPFSSINFFNTPLQLGYEESARLDSSDSKATEVNSFSHALVMYQRDAPVYALDLEGQGTISVSASAAAELCICISSADRSHPSLYLDITPTSCTFSYGYYTSATTIPARPPPDSPYVGTGGGAGSGPGMYLDVNRQTTYWMSIDCPNGILKYGKGYLSSNLTLLEARLKKMDDHGRMVWPETWTFLEKLTEVRVLQTGGDMHALSVATQTLPLVDAPSPYVIPDYRISMNDLESNNFTVVANLPVECQVSSSSHFVAPEEQQLNAYNDLFTASNSFPNNLATSNPSSTFDNNTVDTTMFSPLKNSFNHSLSALPPAPPLTLLPAVDPPSPGPSTATAVSSSTPAPPVTSGSSTSTLSSPFTSTPLVRRPNAGNAKPKTTPKSKLKINTNLRRKPPSPSHRFAKPLIQSPPAPVPVPAAAVSAPSSVPPKIIPTLPPLTLNTLHCSYYSAHVRQPPSSSTSTTATAPKKICTAADPQKLYANVAGPNIVLNTPDFPAFGRAIERSVSTEGCLGYSLLMRKAGEFGGKKGTKVHGGGKDEKPDLTQTYLRITLGSHMINSPGIPYVLEIWPAGHYSPVHEHADSFAIIKVLYGTIHAFFYDSLVNPGGPRMIMDKVELKTGDITWISPQHYQVHQLKNLSKRKEEGGEGTVCCTLQCYQYAYNDTIHYENFRYIPNSDNSSGNSPTSTSTSTSTTSSSPNDSGYDSSSSSDPDMMDFQPNSDMSFGVFKAAIRREWEEYMGTEIGRKEEREFRAREKARGVEMGRTLGGVAAAISKGGEGEGLGGVSEVARKAAEMVEVLAGRERMVGMGMDGGSMEARAEAGMMEVGE